MERSEPAGRVTPKSSRTIWNGSIQRPRTSLEAQMNITNRSEAREREIRIQRYVETLEMVIQKNYKYLKSIMEDFQEKCRLAASTTGAPPGLFAEIPDIYREIQVRLRETQAVQSLLKTRYPQYARNQPGRDKELRALNLDAGTYFSEFLQTLKQRLGEKEVVGKEKLFGLEEIPCFQWFRNQENLVKFLRNVRILDELDYEIAPAWVRERRGVTKDKPRSLTLFIFKGNIRSITNLQSHMRLREHDIIERYAEDELRGILTHLREIQPFEVESIFDRLKQVEGYSELKCLLVPIRGERDIRIDVAALVEKTINEMAPGELRTISI